MSNFFIQFQPLINAIGWTILHSIWQALLLFCGLKLLLKAIPTNRASLKYNISLFFLATQTIWVGITFYDQWHSVDKASIVSNITVETTTGTAQALDIVTPTTLFNQILNGIDANMSIIVQLYIVGIILLLGRMLYSFYSINKVRNAGINSLTSIYNELLTKCKTQLGINKNVLLSITEKVDTPIIIGMLKPIILLPLASINNLTTEQLETIILHELAHIKRHDYLVNIIQVVIETIFFYNPFVWLMSRDIRHEREYCCDDIVTHYSKAKLDYAYALATLNTIKQQSSLSMAATGHKHTLLNRIKRIVEMNKNPINRTQLTIVTLMLVGILSATMLAPKLMAQSKGGDGNHKTKTKDSATKTYTVHMMTEEVTIIDDGDTAKYTRIEDMPQQHRKRIHDAGYNMYFGPNKKYITQDADSTFIVEMRIDTTTSSTIHTTIDRYNRMTGDELSDSTFGVTRQQMAEVRQQMADARKQMHDAQRQLSDAQRQMAQARRQVIIEHREELAKQRDSIAQIVVATRKMHDKQRAQHYRQRTVTLQNMDATIDKLDHDGLINKNDNYTIEIKDQHLYINGEKQKDAILNKYFSDQKDTKSFTIQGSKNNTNIQIKR